MLWQVGIAGDRSLSRFATGADYRRLLVDLLAEHYPLAHEVIAYKAATLPITTARMGKMPLSGLVEAAVLGMQTTLVIPLSGPMQRNPAMLDRLAVLDIEWVAGNAAASIQTNQGSNRVARHPVS